MENQWNYGRCIAILNQEAAILCKISEIQNSIRQAVLEREWVDFDWKMAEMKQIGAEFAQLDAERAALFASLARIFQFGQSVPFYALAARLPENECREITALYRSIKMETLKMKALSESFLGYLDEAKTVTASYLEAAYPARGGKLYTSNGVQTGQDLKSIIFNRHF